nr:hypothetical protein [Tanacetum cinerariifolium]
MKGSGQTLERRKEALFDEFEHFRANGNELIQYYFVRFHKLVNDMKVTQLDIPTHQLNTKFANNLPSYWGKYMTHAKNNMNMSTVTYVELFTHLRTYKEHALKSLKKKEQSSVVVNPLAYLAKTTPTHSTTSPVTFTTPQSSGDSHNDAMLSTMNQIANLLSAPYDQPLALTTTNLFEANHEDAYDSDVDEGPHASAAFMANLSSTGGTNGSSLSHINEVQISDDSFFSDVSYLLAQEMQQEEHLNSKVDSVLDDNMITYEEYQNDSEVEAVPIVVSADEADKQSMIAVLQRMHTEIAGYVRVNDEHILVNATLTAELERCKIEMQALEYNKVKHDLDMDIVERNKRNAELEESKQVLPAAEIASQSSTPAKHVAPFVHTRPVKSDVHKKVWKIKECITAFEKIIKERTAPPPSILSSHRLWHHTKECFDEQITSFFTNIKQLFQTLDTNIFQEVKEFERIFDELDAKYERILLEKKNMQIEKKNLLVTNECLIANSIANDICSVALAYDLVVPHSSDSSHCMLEELRTTCDREHSKVLELEAEILKKQQVINDAEKRCAFIQNEHVKLQLKFQKYKECDTSNSTASNVIFEINKLKYQLQGRDNSIRNLQAQNDIMSLLNVGSTNDSCNKQALETELNQLKDTVTSLKIQNDGYKIAAQKAKIATLNAKTVGNKTSGTTKPENPKETPKPLPRFTKKPVAPLLKKPNINVPLSTGIKSATGASKPASKSNAWIYRKFPAKSVKG